MVNSFSVELISKKKIVAPQAVIHWYVGDYFTSEVSSKYF
jgi:hypothetical protein